MCLVHMYINMDVLTGGGERLLSKQINVCESLGGGLFLEGTLFADVRSSIRTALYKATETI